MKKTIYLLAASLVLGSAINAKPVTPNMAAQVASNFYNQTYQTSNPGVTLAYIEKDAAGLEVYYAFNISNNGGFVLVSAEDAGHPIIGYSNTGNYVTPTAKSNFSYWMQKRKAEITSMRSLKLTASQDISDEWTAYINNTALVTKNNFHKATGTYPSSTAHLVQTTWNQSPYYNADCPGGSVTGCVATAMSQIMKFWSYPPQGRGSNSYCDCSASGFSQNYGTLSANFGTTTYNWANMPLNVNSANTDVATLLYDAGVSVDMDYAPSGSGAWVIAADAPVCAQNSYVNNFGYNPSTIYGFYDSTLSSTNLIDTLQNEINSGRPVEYAGWDPTDGGHTWVCDGYDATNNFHMNWGWAGQDNGWYSLTNLNPASLGGSSFSATNEALIGIEPRNVLANFVASPTFGCSSVSATFTDKTTTNGSISAYSWRFPGGTPSTSNAASPSVTYNAPGVYSVTEIVTASNGIDSVTQAALITVAGPTALPLTQGFETGTFPPTGWMINNPNGHSTTWSTYNGTGGYGKSSNCMFYNNCTGGVIGQYDQMHTALVDYTGNTNPFIYFDVSYEPYGIQGGVDYSDTLAIYYSTDCGTTWNNIYVKGGVALSTTGGTAQAGTDTVGGGGCFLPSSKHWRTDTIVIPAIANLPSVMYSFENRSGDGTGMFIDNINMPKGPLGIATISSASTMAVYPNPNNGSFTVELGNVTTRQQIAIFNVLGQSIYTSTLSEGKTKINLSQPAGVYFYRVLSLDGKTLSEGRMVIK